MISRLVYNILRYASVKRCLPKENTFNLMIVSMCGKFKAVENPTGPDVNNMSSIARNKDRSIDVTPSVLIRNQS